MLTRGSETSQYLEEEKPYGIPLVAASEMGTVQTFKVLKPAGVALEGSWDISGEIGRSFGKLQSSILIECVGKRNQRK